MDQMIPPVLGDIGAYTRDLARALIRTAPRGCSTEAIIASHDEEHLKELMQRLTPLPRIHKTTLKRRELTTAWQLGVATPQLSSGLIHSPTLLAPLIRHDVSDGTQITVTLHDTLAWTHPKSFTATTVASQKAFLKRARKHADALVVPTHAVAEQLSEIADFGDRVRVVSGAVPSTLRLPVNPDARAQELGLPNEYIVVSGSLDPRRGVMETIAAMAVPEAPDVPLLVLGPETWGDLTIESVADEAGVHEGRVAGLGQLSDSDRALVLSRASAFVYPSIGEGFGLPLIEAFTFGTPVIHSDDPALLETSGGAGYVVEAAGRGYPERLAEAMRTVLGDADLRSRLGIQSRDRGAAFSWTDSAERIWALHADL